MSKRVRHVIYGIIIFCFYCAGRLMMRQRPKLKGKEHLEDIPLPIIFTVTHDSYFEIPSLSKIYQALKPKPIFSIMAKKDFLNGNYLSSNFRAKSPFIRSVCKIIDKSGIPKSLFKMMNMATVHRPFIETTMKKKDAFKRELSNQITHFKDTVSQGMSTLIFPEGTTWGFGGLKKIRSAAYQLVSNTFREYGKKVYVLPINVKVDRLVQGYKDVFINVGNPEFILKSKEDFNQYVRNSLLKLHTITFSQLGAYYLKKASILSIQTKKGITLTRENLTVQAERIVKEVNSRVQNKTLPAFDVRLVDKKYLSKKINRFIKYCTRNNYLIETKKDKRSKMYILNRDKVLAQYPAKLFRKLNPVGYHANELTSLGEKEIEPLFDISILDGITESRSH